MKISWLVKLAVLFVLVLTWGNGSALASNMRQLIDRDCRICHAKVIDKLIAAGSTHATDVECRDCHLQHPQQDKGLLADCINCHDPQQSEHYSLGSCRDCHHAHWPLELDFAQIETPVKKLCFSCHENPFAAGSSAHADNLRCSECHTSHALSPSCLDCHQGHGQGTVEEPCLSCHAAHNPVPSIPVAGLDGTLCSACHAATSAALSADDGSHAQMACNDCHAQHGQKPDCLQCHEGHSEAMVAADCKSCHAHHRPMPAVFAAEIKTELCASCHEEVSSLFASAGGKHQQNLSCAACHAGHPPAETSILACSSCHAADENSHFALSDCNSCHNPHSPAIEDLGGLENVRPVCLGCHAGVGVAMAEGATAHSEDLSCNQCHETHGESPSCLNCHQGHDEQMQANDCSQCHQPHRPLPVEFLQGTAADLCNGCHEQTVADFNFSGRAHKIALGCIDCHLEHPPADNVIPECATCHDSAENPHFASENCVACHNPHKPVLDDIFTLTDSRPVCAGCHVQVEEQLTAQISAHSETACVGCHRKHAGVPSCLGCHDGHSETMTAADCLTCHQAHAPLLIDFTQKPSSQLCAACHKQQTEAVASAGAGHRDKLNCSACHQVHPAASCADCHSVHPQKGQAIPENCFACHPPSDRPHFAVGDCQECHSPHQPLNLNLQVRKPLTPVCVSCHQQVAQAFAEMPSGHSSQGCEKCHSQHTKIRICLDCHQPHEKSMVQADCLHCHSPHQPQDIQLQQAAELPRKFCAACHQSEAATFAAKGAAHQQEFASCTACHPEHKPNGKITKLSCGNCHARSNRRHFTLENCVSCHNPHQPLELELAQLAVLRPACVSCHNNQERLTKLYPNKHSDFDCRKCHAGKHGSKMECQECHSPHMPKMTQIQCLKCHPPHFPQMIKEKPGQAGAVCSSCHQAAAGKLKESGSAHKKQPCVSCHRSHPPYGETVFSSCDVCHDPDDDQHFAVNNCQDCHQGHQPLGQDLSTAKNARPACQTCHAEVIAAFEAFPSAHAEQDCNRCHQRHGEALKCADCHEPHSPGMNHADCLNCHSSPHAPGQVAFAGKLPAGFCQSCHAPQVEALATSLAKHNQLTCLDCHQGTHGDRLECSSCHQPPHDPGLHRKFPDCLKCHIDPHNLADWRGSKDAALVNPEAVTTETQKKPAAPDAASSEDVK